jgi:hypothetical protein
MLTKLRFHAGTIHAKPDAVTMEMPQFRQISGFAGRDTSQSIDIIARRVALRIFGQVAR